MKYIPRVDCPLGCGTAFITPGGLVQHMRLFHGEKWGLNDVRRYVEQIKAQAPAPVVVEAVIVGRRKRPDMVLEAPDA